ncbi:hypothetical protein [Streptomyces sp. NPDC056544]|uniref:hypothetical protein n=1 Tax=Streptomyces sp. NPDC056544 TaxID=3345863 RepID=UPI0036779219
MSATVLKVIRLDARIHGCLKTRTLTTKQPHGRITPNPMPLDSQGHGVSDMT